jgi:hypothetical protein
MDPNACLRDLAEAYHASQRHFGTEAGDEAGERLDDHCRDLWDWLERGGFAPDWSQVETVVWSYYECRAIGHRRGE